MTLNRTAIVLAFVLPLWAADPIETDARSGGSMPLPSISGRSLFYVPDGQPDSFRLYGPDGHLAVARSLTGRPTATLVSLEVGPEGSIAISWQDLKAHQACGVDILNKDGETVRSIPTGLFEPGHMAFARDGSLWMFGTEYTSSGYDGVWVDEYATLRHFSAEGKLIGQFLPRSTFAPGLPPANLGNQWQTLFVGDDRVGVLAVDGQDGRFSQWVDVDFEGKVLDRYPVEGYRTHVAMTSDGRVFLQDEDGKLATLSILDRSTGLWRPLSALSHEYLWGVDGNRLLFLSWRSGLVVIDPMEIAQK